MEKTKDPIKGERKGLLVATGSTEMRVYNGRKQEYFQFLCDCGNFVWLRKVTLERREKPSCGIECPVRISLYKIQPGDKINSLTIEERIPKRRKNGDTDQIFICICDCGNREEVSRMILRGENKIKCSVCLRNKIEAGMEPGTKFGAWTLTGNKIYKPTRYEVICKCGIIKYHQKANLIYHKTSQCRDCWEEKII